MTKKRSVALKKNLEMYSFIMPLVAVMLVFLGYPILQTINISFHDWNLSQNNPARDFLGVKNYADVIRDEYFLNTIVVTIKYIIVTVLGRFLLGLVTALLMQRRFKGIRLFRVCVVIPWAVPEVIAAFIWVLMYNRDVGIFNGILRSLGIISKNIPFLQSVTHALPAAMLVNIWKGFPFVAIMLYAGLQSIPTELYEAARVDGSNYWQEVRKITMPMLKPVSSIVFLLLITWTMRDFGIAYILAEGGPVHATEIATIFIYTKAFKYYNIGQAAAASCMMLAVCGIFTVFYLRRVGEEV